MHSDSLKISVFRLYLFMQVPQPFDLSTNYYASIYRPTADGDGRFSPFLLPGAAPKYNGNIAILPPLTSQSPQEVCIFFID